VHAGRQVLRGRDLIELTRPEAHYSASTRQSARADPACKDVADMTGRICKLISEACVVVVYFNRDVVLTEIVASPAIPLDL